MPILCFILWSNVCKILCFRKNKPHCFLKFCPLSYSEECIGCQHLDNIVEPNSTNSEQSIIREFVVKSSKSRVELGESHPWPSTMLWLFLDQINIFENFCFKIKFWTLFAPVFFRLFNTAITYKRIVVLVRKCLLV